jgi:hypothetical protein
MGVRAEMSPQSRPSRRNYASPTGGRAMRDTAHRLNAEPRLAVGSRVLG